MFNYVVTAYRPTAVPHATTGNFTGPNDLNLIVSKTTRIEIHRVTAKGLEMVADVPVYGRVAVMELVRMPGDKQDSLFLHFEKYKFCLLTYDSATGEIRTRANGDTHDRVGRPVEIGQIGLVDPLVRAFALHLYDGQVRIIPADNRGILQEAFNVRLEELVVVDMKFLFLSDDLPQLAILYQDAKGLRHVKTYKVQLKEKELIPGDFQHPNLEPTASVLIPLPTGGVLILGDTTITHQGRATGSVKAIANKFGAPRAWGNIDADGSRYLVGDAQGSLGLLVVIREGNNVSDIKLETLGETSVASTIRYLDNGYVFVGSVSGDPQLVRLATAKNAQGNFVDPIDSYANLGPVIDFCVVDLERQGQGQIVTCSGTGKDGSLRIIRNGIGLNEQATIELSGVKGIWSLRASSSAQFDKFLAVSFVNETRFLAISGEELEEAEIPGFTSTSRTIFCGNVAGDMAVQVTSASVRLINATSLALLSEWKPPATAQINVAACNQTQVVLATGGGRLVYLEIQAAELREVKTVTLEHEIACINVTPLGDPALPSPICAIGMWTDITVRVYRLPSLELITKEKLGGDIIPRSLLFATFEGIHYLLCGLGDGHLFIFVVDAPTSALLNPKKLSLGTQPILLNSFRAKGITNVFAASDRPMVIYSRNKKLLYSTVNLKEVYFMCPFHTDSYPESLAVATESALTIGNIDEIQKLHIRKVALGEMPRRIAHQETSRMFGVVTVRSSVDATTGEETESHFLKLIDDATFEVIDTHVLQANEIGASLISLNFADEETSYFAIGTAFIVPTESEPTRGRVMLFSVVERKLTLVCELEVKGSVYSMSALNGKLLITVNSRLRIFGLTSTDAGGKELQPLAQAQAHIIALHTAVRGDFIAVGDLMKSINLNVFKPADNTIEEIARDYNPNWVTAVEIIDDDTFLGAEQHFNFYVVRRNSEAATDEERLRLLTVGEFHAGDFVNRFRHGSLVMRLSESDATHGQTVLYAGVSGAIGVVATLKAEQFDFFNKLQNLLAEPKFIGGIGGLKHKEWRSFSNDRKTVEATNFIDGDLVELFLDLPRARQDEVARSLELSTEEVSRRIEHLAHALH